MKLYNVDNIPENGILAKDVMLDSNTILLNEGTVLQPNYVDKLKSLGIFHVYIADKVLSKEEAVVILKKDIEEKCKKEIKKVMQRHTYSGNDKIKELSTTANNIINEILEKKEVIENIYEIKERSADVYEHSISICSLATLVALKMNLSNEQVHDISMGCLLHDIGLRSVMVEYQNQNLEDLEDKEQDEYRKHPVYGYNSIKNEKWLSKKVKEIILCHHEKLDGSGYPFRATDIPIEVKIVSVCDSFDEMICGIGCEKLKIYEAVEYMKGFKNILFDGQIVDILLQFTAVYPTGSIVVTNEQESAIVIKQNKNFPERPIIKVIKDKYGRTPEYERVIDLETATNVFIDSVEE